MNETKKFTPSIKSRSTAKKAGVPKSANYKSSKEGDWGKSES